MSSGIFQRGSSTGIQEQRGVGAVGGQAEPHRCFQPWRTRSRLMPESLSQIGTSKQAGQASWGCCHPEQSNSQKSHTSLPASHRWSLVSLPTQPDHALCSPW